MKRIIISCLVPVAIAFLFWSGGFDFNERGFTAAILAYFSIAGFIMTYLYPDWNE